MQLHLEGVEPEVLHRLEHNTERMPDTVGGLYWDKCELELLEFKRALEESYYPYRVINGQYNHWEIHSDFFYEDTDSTVISGLWFTAIQCVEEMQSTGLASCPINAMTIYQKNICNKALFSCIALNTYFKQMETIIHLQGELS